ncbi:MAG: ATPase [Treponema sp.]|nr:ATPase [Treponema sp.]
MKSSTKKFFFMAVLMVLVSVTAVVAQSSDAAEKAAVEAQADSGLGSSIKYIAAALAVGIGCLGGGMAVGKIGAAAMGAMSENAEISGKALPFVGLAEGICLWGFLVALFIILM